LCKGDIVSQTVEQARTIGLPAASGLQWAPMQKRASAENAGQMPKKRSCCSRALAQVPHHSGSGQRREVSHRTKPQASASVLTKAAERPGKSPDSINGATQRPNHQYVKADESGYRSCRQQAGKLGNDVANRRVLAVSNTLANLLEGQPFPSAYL